MTTTSLPQPRPLEKTRFRARFNWPLIIGILLVGLVVYLAIVGPEIAPFDPLAENVILKDERTGEWHMPPFQAFEVTGYLLGSDEFGRDLYSRLLWAIRPTLEMVAIVATVRLVMGTLIGLVAGWSIGRVGRVLDTLISGALALPGLLVALGTIAIVGVELGLIAFVIGLSVTGWAETARIVREQTRVIKSQVYIEAANAMGASDTQIIQRHVLRQIQAMLLMLLAFEIGSTLMLTAGLGFLGYYIGGDVWVDVSDFVARRTSGTPELGQMLATAWVRLTDPWGLVSVGSVVFALVLGFNLIGEGLRLRLSHEVQGGLLKWLGDRLAGVSLWVEDRIAYPVGKFLERPVPFVLFRVMLGIVVGATAVWGWRQGWFKLPEAEISFLFGDPPTDSQALTPLPEQSAQATTPIPQTLVISANPEPNSGWIYDAPEPLMSEPIIGRDGTVLLLGESQTLYVLAPDGSLRAAFPLPTPLYVFQDSGSGGGDFLLPAIMGDGSVLVVSDEKVYALDPDGNPELPFRPRWEFLMDRPPYSFPTEDTPRGLWFLIDDRGTLYAFSPTDGLRWTHDLAEGLRAASDWPVFGPNGEIYYTITNRTEGMIEALNPDGSPLWRVDLTTLSFYKPLDITPDGNWLMVDDNLIHTPSSRLLETDSLEFEVDEFAMGYDGKQYLMAGSSVMEWETSVDAEADGLRIVNQVAVAFPENRQRGAVPQLSVSKDGIYWIRLFAGFGRLQTNMWVNAEGEILGIVNVDTEEERIIEMDEENGRLTVCKSNPEVNWLECRGYDGRSSNPVWQVNIEGLGGLNNYFYEEGRLYVLVDEDTVQVIEVEFPD